MKLVPKEELANRLFAARKKMRYTYEMTAKTTGLTIQTLFNVEKGVHPRVTLGTQTVLSEFILYAENDYIEPEYAPKRWSNRNEF